MPGLDSDLLFGGLIQVLVLLFAISVHESAHAWTAWRCGDPTAYALGRVSLNPLRHLDAVGSLLVPVLLLITGGPIFGWAKPTPVRVGKLRSPERDHLLVTLAGPASNLALFGLALITLGTLLAILGPEARDTAQASLLRDLPAARRGEHFPLLFSLVQLAFLNGFLGLFNLLPVPPLDGGQLALQLLPTRWATRYSALQPYGFMIVLVLAMLQVLWLLVIPVYMLIALVIQLSV